MHSLGPSILLPMDSRHLWEEVGQMRDSEWHARYYARGTCLLGCRCRVPVLSCRYGWFVWCRLHCFFLPLSVYSAVQAWIDGYDLWAGIGFNIGSSQFRYDLTGCQRYPLERSDRTLTVQRASSVIERMTNVGAWGVVGHEEVGPNYA